VLNLSVNGDLFVILINKDAQYTLWPSGKAAPNGWTRVGVAGRKEDCFAFIEANWVDMRPSALRMTMKSGAHA
jgi:MbtH protein